MDKKCPVHNSTKCYCDERNGFFDKTIYCQDCPEVEAEYLWKDGKDFIPICQACAERWSLEERIDNNDVLEIESLDDEELEEFKEKYGK